MWSPLYTLSIFAQDLAELTEGAGWWGGGSQIWKAIKAKRPMCNSVSNLSNAVSNFNNAISNVTYGVVDFTTLISNVTNAASNVT